MDPSILRYFLQTFFNATIQKKQPVLRPFVSQIQHTHTTPISARRHVENVCLVTTTSVVVETA